MLGCDECVYTRESIRIAQGWKVLRWQGRWRDFWRHIAVTHIIAHLSVCVGPHLLNVHQLICVHRCKSRLHPQRQAALVFALNHHLLWLTTSQNSALHKPKKKDRRAKWMDFFFLRKRSVFLLFFFCLFTFYSFMDSDLLED